MAEFSCFLKNMWGEKILSALCCARALAFVGFFLVANIIGAQESELKEIELKAINANDAIAAKINRWYADGTAAGNHGDFYDNRDGGHSNINLKKFPQLEKITYDEATKLAKGHLSIPRQIHPDKVIIGNCSMAARDVKMGSLPRNIMRDKGAVDFFAAMFLQNHIYVFPEHRDHDPGINGNPGYGDLFPGNLPFWLISQGSSYSDKPFVDAFLQTLAALQPRMKKNLRENKLLAPILQTALRRSYGKGKFDYFSAEAHPVVFNSSQLDVNAMVEFAHNLTVANMPPLFSIKVANENRPLRGVDFFEPSNITTDELYTTPFGLARVLRNSAEPKKMQIEIDKYFHTSKAKPTLRWQLLRGDPNSVKITPAADGKSAQIEVRWQAPQFSQQNNQRSAALDDGQIIASSRLEIGIFASVGENHSLPTILSFYSLPSEHRSYDSAGNLSEIHYRAGSPRLGLPARGSQNYFNFFAEYLFAEKKSTAANLANQLFSSAEKKLLAEQWQIVKTDFFKLGENASRVQKLSAQRNQTADAGEKKLIQQQITKINQQQKQLRAKIAKIGKQAVGNFASGNQIIGAKIYQLASNPEFFLNPANMDLLSQIAQENNSADKIRSAVAELEALGIARLHRNRIQVFAPADQPLAANLQYHLRQLNYYLFAEVIFAQFLQREQGALIGNPLLSSAKNWRDVYHYHGDKLSGWTRFWQGKTITFDARGRIITNDGKTFLPTYQIQGKFLSF